jgi:hypothetical protein
VVYSIKQLTRENDLYQWILPVWVTEGRSRAM